jgi:pentatricopeptide repeat protein
MSEMLGNQYFMARNYSAAQKEFEEVLSKYPDNRSAKKKLVVCYTQTGKLKEAFSFFNDLVRNDIEFIIKTDPIKDDCPCPELIDKLEPKPEEISYSYDYNLSMGIIWLYCDVHHSLKYFTLLHESDPNNSDVEYIIQSIQKYLERDSEVTSRV